jgi:ubiquinone/menaquinone biosynthesis C-methylase UbiE
MLKMKGRIKGYINRISDKIVDRIIRIFNREGLLADNIAFRVAQEMMLDKTTTGKQPNEIFYGISDNFWFWLNTEGVRRNSVLRNILPGVPDEYTQVMFTGDKGDTTLKEAFFYYKIFKEQYQKYNGNISEVNNILDFGCGWGRIIRFFLKDLEGSKIWGCDPVKEMIDLCKKQNKWCNFENISTEPPTPFQDNTFDMIYSYSVFSHLSEDFHLNLLAEVKRILKPGGIYITTTRNRKFIEICAEMRKLSDLNSMNPGPRSSAQAFLNTRQSLSEFDRGEYCHHSFNDKKWPYWGETAIPKKYVLDHWTQSFTVLDFIDLDVQNVIVVQKPLV